MRKENVFCVPGYSSTRDPGTRGLLQKSGPSLVQFSCKLSRTLLFSALLCPSFVPQREKEVSTNTFFVPRRKKEVFEVFDDNRTELFWTKYPGCGHERYPVLGYNKCAFEMYRTFRKLKERNLYRGGKKKRKYDQLISEGEKVFGRVFLRKTFPKVLMPPRNFFLGF